MLLLKVFLLVIMADKQMFKALVMVELLDSEKEKETKGRRMTINWLKKERNLVILQELYEN